MAEKGFGQTAFLAEYVSFLPVHFSVFLFDVFNAVIKAFAFSSCMFSTGPGSSVVEHPLREREVVDSNPGRAIPKALKMVPVATLLDA